SSPAPTSKKEKGEVGSMSVACGGCCVFIGGSALRNKSLISCSYVLVVVCLCCAVAAQPTFGWNGTGSCSGRCCAMPGAAPALIPPARPLDGARKPPVAVGRAGWPDAARYWGSGGGWPVCCAAGGCCRVFGGCGRGWG